MNNLEISNIDSVAIKLKAYYELLKPRLSFLVAFSAAFGFLLGAEGTPDLFLLLMLSVGSFLISGAAVTINQVIEWNLDILMRRTSGRPIPTSKITQLEATIYSVVVYACGDLFGGLLYQYICGAAGYKFFDYLCLYVYALKKGRSRSCFCWSHTRRIASLNRMGCRNGYAYL